MHVCLVSREYPPNPMGGIGTYVVNMARILALAGHTVSVLTQAHPDAPAGGIDNPVAHCAGALRVYYLPFVDADWRLLPGAGNPQSECLMRRDAVAGFGPIVSAALEVLIRREQVDVIEAPEYEAPLLHFQQRRATLAGDHPWRRIPCVVHLHSPSHMIFLHNDDPLTGRWVRARKAHEALSITLADGVLSPSAFLGRQVRAWLDLPRERVEVLPYPIGPLLDYDPQAPAEDGLCLFVGRVEPRKGVFEFVEAAVRVARRHPKARFRFVGGPHFRDGKSGGTQTSELLLSLIPGPLRERFDFAGRVPRDSLGAEYRRAAFAAVPSRWDNYPNTCMEAMSCARPVLASDQGGMAEMVEDGVSGLIAAGGAQPTTPAGRAELARNLERALDRMLTLDPGRLHTMGEAARARILQACGDDAIIQRHIEYYGRLRTDAGSHPARSQEIPAAVLLLDDGAVNGAGAARALSAVAAQDSEPAGRVLVGRNLAQNHLLTGQLTGWSLLAGDAEGIDEGLDPLPIRLGQVLAGTGAGVAYVGAADDVLSPGALRMAARYLANHPRCGACACWTRQGGVESAFFRNAPLHLLAPALHPERWFFRVAALRACGGVFVNGGHLPDLLRDAVLRLVAAGWRIGCIGETLVDVRHREHAPVLRPFAFQERRDSIRAVVQAHAPTFAADPANLGEQLSVWAD